MSNFQSMDQLSGQLPSDLNILDIRNVTDFDRWLAQLDQERDSLSPPSIFSDGHRCNICGAGRRVWKIRLKDVIYILPTSRRTLYNRSTPGLKSWLDHVDELGQASRHLHVDVVNACYYYIEKGVPKVAQNILLTAEGLRRLRRPYREQPDTKR